MVHWLSRERRSAGCVCPARGKTPSEGESGNRSATNVKWHDASSATLLFPLTAKLELKGPVQIYMHYN